MRVWKTQPTEPGVYLARTAEMETEEVSAFTDGGGVLVFSKIPSHIRFDDFVEWLDPQWSPSRPAALRWTREPPTAEGAYWLLDRLRRRTYLARVQEGLVWNLERDDGQEPHDEPLTDFEPERWMWAGPLTPPELKCGPQTR